MNLTKNSSSTVAKMNYRFKCMREIWNASGTVVVVGEKRIENGLENGDDDKGIMLNVDDY